MNFFSSNDFLGVVAATRFPGKSAEYIECRIEGAESAGVFRVLSVEGRIVPGVPFLDFFEACPHAGPAPRSASWLAAVVHDKVSAELWLAQRRTRESSRRRALRAAPTIVFSRFAAWAEYSEYVRARPGSAFGKTAKRRKKKLAQEVGEVRFELQDKTPGLVDQCMAWKSAQYLRTGLVDSFSRSANVRLFKGLEERGLLTVSALYAGDRVVAIHAGMVDATSGRLYYWLPAYDPELGLLSTGSIMNEEIIAASYAAGHREFDFLLGDEDYKWKFATDARLVGPLGERWWQDEVYGPIRRRAIGVLKRNSRAYGLIQNLKHRWYSPWR